MNGSSSTGSFGVAPCWCLNYAQEKGLNLDLCKELPLFFLGFFFLSLLSDLKWPFWLKVEWTRLFSFCLSLRPMLSLCCFFSCSWRFSTPCFWCCFIKLLYLLLIHCISSFHVVSSLFTVMTSFASHLLHCVCFLCIVLLPMDCEHFLCIMHASSCALHFFLCFFMALLLPDLLLECWCFLFELGWVKSRHLNIERSDPHFFPEISNLCNCIQNRRCQVFTFCYLGFYCICKIYHFIFYIAMHNHLCIFYQNAFLSHHFLLGKKNWYCLLFFSKPSRQSPETERSPYHKCFWSNSTSNRVSFERKPKGAMGW